jgi:hypothetical protein
MRMTDYLARDTPEFSQGRLADEWQPGFAVRPVLFRGKIEGCRGSRFFLNKGRWVLGMPLSSTRKT